MEKQFPGDTTVRFNYLPTVRALIALERAEPEKAVEILQVAAPHELGIPLSGISGLFGALYPVYVRGQAYLAENKPTEAIVEFQKILDHRGIVGDDGIGALAHLQIGRAFAMAGDHTKAQAAYQAFFGLWKDADAEIPVFKQAKAEYANLH
jgi:tetratricopeptide (TPR) repeat protein